MWSACADRLLVVLHHDHRVAEVPQLLQRAEEAQVVALVQADGGLVQDVEHADQPRSDLGRQPDPLRLAAGERLRRAPEGEVLEPTSTRKRSRSVTSFRIGPAISAGSSRRPSSASKNSSARPP
jgi:hypothetical protein